MTLEGRWAFKHRYSRLFGLFFGQQVLEGLQITIDLVSIFPVTFNISFNPLILEIFLIMWCKLPSYLV